MAEWRKVYRSFFEDEDIGTKLAPLGRQVLICMIVFADDEGYVELAPAIWRKRAFGYDDDVSTTQVKAWVDAIMALRRSRDDSPMIEDLGFGIGRFTRWDDFNRARGDRAKDSTLRIKLRELKKSTPMTTNGNQPAPKGGRKSVKTAPELSQNGTGDTKTAPGGGEENEPKQAKQGEAEGGQAEACVEGEAGPASGRSQAGHGHEAQVVNQAATNGVPDGNQGKPSLTLKDGSATTGTPPVAQDKSRAEEKRVELKETAVASRSRTRPQAMNDEDIEDVVNHWSTRFPNEDRPEESIIQDLLTKSRESNQDPRMIVSMVPKDARSPRGYLIRLVRHTVPFPSLHESMRHVYTWHSFERRTRKHRVSSVGEILREMTQK